MRTGVGVPHDLKLNSRKTIMLIDGRLWFEKSKFYLSSGRTEMNKDVKKTSERRLTNDTSPNLVRCLVLSQ